MEYASHDKPFPANGFSNIVASYANDGAAGYDMMMAEKSHAIISRAIIRVVVEWCGRNVLIRRII